MSFRFRKREHVPAAIRRLATEQVDAACALLTAPPGDEARRIHETRKSLKKLRALLRLLRRDLGAAYAVENAAYRDAARALAGIRDADALLLLLDGLERQPGAALPRSVLAALRADLDARRVAALAHPDALGETMHAVARDLQAARARIADWPLRTHGFAALAPGLERAYRRGRAALADLRADADSEAIHEWRKQAKDHWYHIRLLQPLWPSLLAAYQHDLAHLTEWQGEEHDLYNLDALLAADAARYGSPDEIAQLRATLDARRAVLRQHLFALGDRLYAEKPARLLDRLAAYWDVWHRTKKRHLPPARSLTKEV